MVNTINKLRSQNGVAPLEVSISLQNAAQWMATDMAANNYFATRDSLRRPAGTRLPTFGYTWYWGEDQSNTYSDAQNIFNLWLLDCMPDANGACTYAHKRFLLDPHWVVIGIGRAYSANSQYGWYWDLNVGTYRDAVLSASATPPPAITSLLASPATINAGGTTALYWNVLSANTVTIDNGVGDVTNTNFKQITPTKTTTYTLTATNAGGTSTATATVTVTNLDNLAPTPPALITATAKSATQVDLTWSASVDNIGVTGYQVIRNNQLLGSVGSSTLSYSDMTAVASSNYSYQIRAFDAASNLSGASNLLQVTTPAPPIVSSCPVGSGIFAGCYYAGTGLSGLLTKLTNDPQIMFDWSNAFSGRPAPMSNFSVKWRGTFNLPAGNYSFNTVTSDGMRVFLDGAKVLDAWKDQQPTLYGFNVAVVKSQQTGDNHLIEVEYYNNKSGWPIAYLWWNKQ